MASVPSASWNSRSITHLANYLSRNLPMNSSDESFFDYLRAFTNRPGSEIVWDFLDRAGVLRQVLYKDVPAHGMEFSYFSSHYDSAARCWRNIAIVLIDPGRPSAPTGSSLSYRR